MPSTTLTALAAFVGLALSACSYGYRPIVAQAGFEATYEPVVGQARLYFEGMTPPSDVEELGYIEVKGGVRQTFEEVAATLRRQAARRGARAVIHVKRVSAVREFGNASAELLGATASVVSAATNGPEARRVQSRRTEVVVLSGIAVR